MSYTQIDLMLAKPRIVHKGWGKEIIFTASDRKYTGKLLEFKKDSKISLHYHIEKDETWYIYKGTGIFRTIDKNTTVQIVQPYKPGMIFEIKPGYIHQLIAEEETLVFEVSTPDNPKDSYRVEPGDSQKEK